MSYQETAKCDVVVPKLQGVVNRINQVLNEVSETTDSIERKVYSIYNVPRPEDEKMNKSCEPSDYIGHLDALENRIRTLNSKLNSINSHFGELI